MSKEKGLTVYRITDLIEYGISNTKPFPKVKPENICLLSYTSGTTGVPKGAMISHQNLVCLLAGSEKTIPVEHPIHLSYLPLAHIYERSIFIWTIFKNGKYGMFNGDVQKLKDDLAILKPNLFASVPRLFNRFYDKIQSTIKNTRGCSATILSRAIKVKSLEIESTGKCTDWLYDRLVFNKMKAALGGEVELILSASAPLSTKVRQFLKMAFCARFSEGYGQTESLGGSFMSDPKDKQTGTVGGPLPHNEFKLIDIPEMGYYSTDVDDQGRSSPRGEILVRGTNIIPAYYKNEIQTLETIDAEGWLHSGDVG